MSKILEKSNKLYLLIDEQLRSDKLDFDYLNLKENCRKPLLDSQIKNEDFEVRMPVDPDFPFDYINKHIVKLKADTDKKDLHKKTYIFPDPLFCTKKEDKKSLEKDLSGEHCNYHNINSSNECAEIFLKTLIKMSEECTKNFEQYPDEKVIIKKSRFFLIGRPGVGKTTFLNYLISVFAEEVIFPNKAIIIRVDLNDAINKVPDFKGLILTKFQEVFRNYFFSRQIYHIDFNCLEKFIIDRRKIENDMVAITRLKSDILAFKENYEKLNYAFLNDMMAYLSEKVGILFVFFIDGLDYVTLDEIHNNIFKEWVKEINDYILSKHAYKGSYVISMRDVSYNKALQPKSGSTNEIWKNPKKLKVKKCDLKLMLEKKLNLAKKEILQKINGMKIKKLASYSFCAWLTPEVIDSLLLEFQTYISLPLIDAVDERLSKIKRPVDLKMHINGEGLKVLEKISFGNYRCVMRNLKLTLDYFAFTYGQEIDVLESTMRSTIENRLRKLKSRAYLVLRALVVGRREIEEYRVPYSYDLNSDGKIIFVKMGTRFVIPPITNFVYLYDTAYPHKQYRGLVKIRILQYLVSVNMPVSINHVLMFLEDNFGYDKNYVKLDIEEMLYSQLITITNSMHYNKEIDYNITYTDLSVFIMDKLLFWYIYYEATIDSLPMPGSVARQIRANNYYWKRTKKQLYKYIVEKARSVMRYLIFLEYVEQKEKDQFLDLQEQKENSKDKIKYETYFSIIFPKIIDFVSKDILTNFSSRINDEMMKKYCTENFSIDL